MKCFVTNGQNSDVVYCKDEGELVTTLADLFDKGIAKVTLRLRNESDEQVQPATREPDIPGTKPPRALLPAKSQSTLDEEAAMGAIGDKEDGNTTIDVLKAPVSRITLPDAED